MFSRINYLCHNLQRCQSGILKAFHLPDTVKANKVDEDMRLKIKGNNIKKIIMDKQ